MEVTIKNFILLLRKYTRNDLKFLTQAHNARKWEQQFESIAWIFTIYKLAWLEVHF